MSIASDYETWCRAGIESGAIDYTKIDAGSDMIPGGIRELGLQGFEALHVMGDPSVLDGPLVALTGSRRIDEASAERARACGVAAARAGVTLVTGGALGCDLAATTACLEEGGNVVIIPGCGPDVLYPTSADKAFRAAAGGRGCVCSPYPLGTPPRRWQFLKRNGLIVACADLLVCPAAKVPSGSFATLKMAADLNVRIGLIEGCGVSPKNLFPYSQSILDIQDAGEVLEEQLEQLMCDSRAARFCDELAAGIERANGAWRVSVLDEGDGFMLECETIGDVSGYDYVGYLDMRGKDPLDARAWAKEALELAESFDVDEEVNLNLGGSGAPGVETMVDEFKDIRDRTLPGLYEIVREISGRVAEKLCNDSGNEPLAVQGTLAREHVRGGAPTPGPKRAER